MYEAITTKPINEIKEERMVNWKIRMSYNLTRKQEGCMQALASCCSVDFLELRLDCNSPIKRKERAISVGKLNYQYAKTRDSGSLNEYACAIS